MSNNYFVWQEQNLSLKCGELRNTCFLFCHFKEPIVANKITNCLFYECTPEDGSFLGLGNMSTSTVINRARADLGTRNVCIVSEQGQIEAFRKLANADPESPQQRAILDIQNLLKTIYTTENLNIVLRILGDERIQDRQTKID